MAGKITCKTPAICPKHAAENKDAACVLYITIFDDAIDLAKPCADASARAQTPSCCERQGVGRAPGGYFCRARGQRACLWQRAAASAARRAHLPLSVPFASRTSALTIRAAPDTRYCREQLGRGARHKATVWRSCTTERACERMGQFCQMTPYVQCAAFTPPKLRRFIAKRISAFPVVAIA